MDNPKTPQDICFTYVCKDLGIAFRGPQDYLTDWYLRILAFYNVSWKEQVGLLKQVGDKVHLLDVQITDIHTVKIYLIRIEDTDASEPQYRFKSTPANGSLTKGENNVECSYPFTICHNTIPL